MVYGWGVCALYYMIHKEKNVKKQVFCLLVSWLFLQWASNVLRSLL